MTWTPKHESLLETCHLIASRNDAITARQLCGLLVLYKSGRALRFGELAKGIGCPKPSVTRVHQSLVRLGFASRERNPRDRRDILVTITAAGEAFASALGAQELAAAA